MSDIPTPKRVDLTVAVRKVATAHQTINEAIANHAERHRLAYDQKRDQLRQQQALARELSRADTPV